MDLPDDQKVIFSKDFSTDSTDKPIRLDVSISTNKNDISIDVIDSITGLRFSQIDTENANLSIVSYASYDNGSSFVKLEVTDQIFKLNDHFSEATDIKFDLVKDLVLRKKKYLIVL